MVPTRLIAYAAASILLMVTTGCESNEAAPSAAGSATTTGTASSSAHPSTAASASGSAKAPASPPSSAAASGSAHVTLPGHSPLPTVEEWTSAREVTVRGSSALKCETKLIREWFQVTCRKHDDFVPHYISLVSERVPGMMVFSSDRGLSLVMPYVEGSEHRAVFNWSNDKSRGEHKRHTLVVEWPRGAPKPPIIGRFEGAASPLPPPPAKPGSGKHDDFVCDCYETGFDGQVPPIQKNKCREFLKQWPVHEDCARSYHSDCWSYYACSTGSWHVTPKCPEGNHSDNLNVCRKECSADADCGDGLSCRKPKNFKVALCFPKKS